MDEHARALGRKGKGIPKTLSPEERERRSRWAKKLNLMRRKKAAAKAASRKRKT
jgi:hypothetical protein